MLCIVQQIKNYLYFFQKKKQRFFRNQSFDRRLWWEWYMKIGGTISVKMEQKYMKRYCLKICRRQGSSQFTWTSEILQFLRAEKASR